MALTAINDATDHETTSKNVEIAVIKTEDEKYVKLSPDEVQKYIDEVLPKEEKEEIRIVPENIGVKVENVSFHYTNEKENVFDVLIGVLHCRQTLIHAGNRTLDNFIIVMSGLNSIPVCQCGLLIVGLNLSYVFVDELITITQLVDNV